MKKIKKYEPCSLEIVNRKFPMNTICNDLRKIYFEAERLGNEKIMITARIAITKAKRMVSKLEEYNPDIDNELYERSE